MRTMEDVLNHLRAEYMEMPGLRLKARQVQRLCGVEPTMCQQVLDCLEPLHTLTIGCVLTVESVRAPGWPLQYCAAV